MKNKDDRDNISGPALHNFDHEQQLLLFGIFDVIPAVISIISLGSRTVLYRNRDVLSLLDFEDSEIIGMPMSEKLGLFHEDDLPVISAYYDRFLCLKDSQESNIEYRMKNKKGHWESITTSGRIFSRDEDGLISQILMISQIKSKGLPGKGRTAKSKRKTQQQIPIDIRKRFQSIVSFVPALLWDSDPDGAANWYNEHWLEYTGQHFEQAVGWGWIDAIHPDDREGSAMRYRRAVTEGEALIQEHRIRRHDGKYRWFIVNTLPVRDLEGNVVKMYGSATDIHDLRQAEEALHESEEKYRTLYESTDKGFKK